MPIAEHLQEFPPARIYRQGDRSTLYWIRNNKIMCGGDELRGADLETFWFYLGGFAKDHKHCYCNSTRLAGGNGATFRALNYTYYTDGTSVWTMGGKIKDVDAETFLVCDDGAHSLGRDTIVPYGFGKDKNRVYYYDFDGKPNWVRKASSATFVSLNDGYFGKDDNFVFCGAATIPKAKVAHWHLIGGLYSKDNARVYYFNRQIGDADYDTFVFVQNSKDLQLARDKYRYYWNDFVISEDEFLTKLDAYSQ